MHSIFSSLSYSHISIREAEIPSQILKYLHVWTQADNIQIVEEVRSLKKKKICSVILLPLFGSVDGGDLHHLSNMPTYNNYIIVDSNVVLK